MFNRSYINEHKGHPHYLTNLQIDSLREKMVISDGDNNLLSIIRSMSDRTKYRICLLLKHVDEIHVTDIAGILDMSQSSVSHALSELKLLGLVEAHKCGKLICYQLKKSKQINQLLKLIKNFN